MIVDDVDVLHPGVSSCRFIYLSERSGRSAMRLLTRIIALAFAVGMITAIGLTLLTSL